MLFSWVVGRVERIQAFYWYIILGIDKDSRGFPKTQCLLDRKKLSRCNSCRRGVVGYHARFTCSSLNLREVLGSNPGGGNQKKKTTKRHRAAGEAGHRRIHRCRGRRVTFRAAMSRSEPPAEAVARARVARAVVARAVVARASVAVVVVGRRGRRDTVAFSAAGGGGGRRVTF